MLVKDFINKTEVDMTKDELIEAIAHGNRQADLFFDYVKSDCEDEQYAYLHWNQENWTSVDGKRFICSYFMDGRALSDYGGYNISDVGNYFMPDEAKEIVLG